MATLPNPPLTEEQYLEIERQAFEKSEFHDGQMFAVSGGTPNHALLSAAVCALLHGRLPPECRVFSSDLRVKAEAVGLYTYPDCTVICGNPQLYGSRKDVALNPVLIAEVLSPSTEDYDRGKKFEWYRTIKTFREYLIVHQDRRHVEHYSKQDDGSWVLREHLVVDAAVSIPRLGVEIRLADLYAQALDLE